MRYTIFDAFVFTLIIAIALFWLGGVVGLVICWAISELGLLWGLIAIAGTCLVFGLATAVVYHKIRNLK